MTFLLNVAHVIVIVGAIGLIAWGAGSAYLRKYPVFPLEPADEHRARMEALDRAREVRR